MSAGTPALVPLRVAAGFVVGVALLAVITFLYFLQLKRARRESETLKRLLAKQKGE